MGDSSNDKVGIDILEGIIDDSLDFNDDEFNLMLNNLDCSIYLTPEPMIFSEESFPVFDPVESTSRNIPTNRKEWMVTDKNSRRRRPPRLYEFLILLLLKPHYASYASYTNESQGIFQIHLPDMVADLWQQIKNRQSNLDMTYDKFARAIRWYYKSDIMRKTNTRYTFQFSPGTLKGFDIDQSNNSFINYSYVNQ
jgi:hypothetical protein